MPSICDPLGVDVPSPHNIEIDFFMLRDLGPSCAN